MLYSSLSLSVFPAYACFSSFLHPLNPWVTLSRHAGVLRTFREFRMRRRSRAHHPSSQSPRIERVVSFVCRRPNTLLHTRQTRSEASSSLRYATEVGEDATGENVREKGISQKYFDMRKLSPTFLCVVRLTIDVCTVSLMTRRIIRWFEAGGLLTQLQLQN